MSSARRGVILAGTAAFWGALFLIPYKAASEAAPRLVVVLAMVLCAAVFNSLAGLVQTRGRVRIDRLAATTALGLALCTAVGNYAMAASLARTEPAITSVVLQVQIILVAVGELLLHRVRPGRALIVGAALALAGFVLMRAPWASAAAADPLGLLWAGLAAVSFAAMLLATRHVITRIDPLAVNALRLWLAAAALALWPGVVAGAIALDPVVWFYAAAAAACGPTISRLLLMYALRHVTAAQAKLVTLVSPVFALVLGALAFGVWPTAQELLGGAVILAGVALPLAAALRRRREQPPGIDALPP